MDDHLKGTESAPLEKNFEKRFNFSRLGDLLSPNTIILEFSVTFRLRETFYNLHTTIEDSFLYGVHHSVNSKIN